MNIEDIINEECVTFETEESMDNIQSAEYFKEAKNLMVGSHFTMTEDKKKSTRLATNEERLMLFEEMFKYGITFDKHEHRLIGMLV